MNGKDLEEISEECDLERIVQQDLKWNKHCSKSVTKINRILGMIKKIILLFEQRCGIEVM
jgi:hypothetical protein